MMRRLRKLITFRRILAFFVISVLVWFLVVLSLAAMIFVVGEQDEAQASDVIIVLGSGLRRDGRPGDALNRRSVWGAHLYTQGIAPVVICTGGTGEGQRRSRCLRGSSKA